MIHEHHFGQAEPCDRSEVAERIPDRRGIAHLTIELQCADPAVQQRARVLDQPG